MGVPVGSYHTLFQGTQLYGFGILTPKFGNQKKWYGISLQVVDISLTTCRLASCRSPMDLASGCACGCGICTIVFVCGIPKSGCELQSVCTICTGF